MIPLTFTEVRPGRSVRELGPYLTFQEVRPYDRIVKGIETMAEYLVGEEKPCGVTVKAQAAPFDFKIDAAIFNLLDADGQAVPEFMFDAARIKIAGHDVTYRLDSSGLKPNTRPYLGKFDVTISHADIGTEKHIGVILVQVRRVRGTT